MEDVYVVVKMNGKLKKERRKVKAFTTPGGAQFFASNEGDTVVKLAMVGAPVYINKAVL